MKRDYYGNALPDSVYFNFRDFQEKIRALVEFTTNSCSQEKFADDFLIYIVSDKKDQSKRNIQFHWYCRKFLAGKNAKVEDARDHEEVLGKHFKDYNLQICKNQHSWVVEVSTPDKKPGQFQFQMPPKTTPPGTV